MGEHYFDAEPRSSSGSRPIKVSLPGGEIEMVTDGGVFSPKRLDPGTKVLLEGMGDLCELPDAPIVDVGCGYGPIVAHLALTCADRRFWAVDVNARARELCRMNMEALGIADRVHVLSPQEIPAEAIAAMVSNPPIRVGKPALHELLEFWLSKVIAGGESWLVVQKHLGADSLKHWLTEQGWPTEKISSKKGYRLLRVGAAPGGSQRQPARSSSR